MRAYLLISLKGRHCASWLCLGLLGCILSGSYTAWFLVLGPDLI